MGWLIQTKRLTSWVAAIGCKQQTADCQFQEDADNDL